MFAQFADAICELPELGMSLTQVTPTDCALGFPGLTIR